MAIATRMAPAWIRARCGKGGTAGGTQAGRWLEVVAGVGTIVRA